MPLSATIVGSRRATPRSVRLEIALGRPFPFRAGQAVMVGAAGGADRRAYSIAVGPREAARTGRLELLVGVGTDGVPGPHLPSIEAGTRVDVDGPVGKFLLPDRVAEPAILFVAGGTGIAPLRAMLHEVLESPTAPRVSILYSARTEVEFAFDDELTALSRDGRIRYRKTATRESGASWEGGRGRISRAQLEAVVDRADTLCFVCGPAALVHEVPRLLREIGVGPDRIRVEEWAASRAATP